MCGICGIVNYQGAPVSHDVLKRMTAILSHRGPDGEGKLLDGAVGLGHRRLSIIDVTGGGQPIANEDGSIHVVFNGEIYNYIELREKLITRGHCFKTKSDTEVIVHAYEEWGVDCLARFNGIFALALWDAPRRQLVLARDQLGVKPLYYTETGSQLVFASEIKALLQHPICPREVNVEALGELFTFRYVPSPKTLFKGIWKLPPGHLMLVSEQGARVQQFWNWRPEVGTTVSESWAVEVYQGLLEDAIRLQLRSDVPLGLFLSSGIDSGAILAIMRQHVTGPIHTFTIGFESGEKTNEVDDARMLARRFDASHEALIVRPDDYLAYYDRYMWDIEEPVGNETAAAFYFVSKIARSRVKVALSGQGADEPWAGYDRYLGVKLSEVYSRLPQPLTETVAACVSRLPVPWEQVKRAAVSLGERDVLTRLTKVYSFFSAKMQAQLFQPWLKEQMRFREYGSKEALARLQADVSDLDPLSQILYIDTRANLPDDLLMVGDKTSMANSLEMRVPFLDVRLVEFIETLPPHFKLRGIRAKYLHKRALEKWLPADIVYRKKKGFANPIDQWMRTHMKPFVEECLLAGDSATAQFFNQGYVKSLIERDCAGIEQLRRHLYLLLSFELWHRRFMRS